LVKNDLSNRIKNNSRIFEHPQNYSSSDSGGGCGKEKVVFTFYSKFLTPEQREDRVTSCQDIIAMVDADKFFLNKIITGDETWCFAYDPETKRQGSEWVGDKFPRPKELKFQKSRIKNMLIIIFDRVFVSDGKTINAEFYKGVMDGFLKRIQRVRPAAFCSRDFFFLHDNSPTQKAAIFRQFLTQKMLQPFITPRTLQIYLRQTIS